MRDRYFNPFPGIDLLVPEGLHEEITRYSQREGRVIIDQSPFPRMVDMWFLAVCVAAREGIPPADLSGFKARKFHEGSIFGSDPWRVHTLMLIAIAQTGTVEIVSEPRKMIAIANGLAFAGLPRVLEMLKDGEGEAIWNLSEAIEMLIKRKRST